MMRSGVLGLAVGLAAIAVVVGGGNADPAAPPRCGAPLSLASSRMRGAARRIRNTVCGDHWPWRRGGAHGRFSKESP